MDDLAAQLARVLEPTYTLEGEFGVGGMSRVFAATDNTLHRRVAVKVLAPELAAALSVDRFEREIALSAGLQHPNIVPVLTAGVVEGLPFYTMPFVDGESLRARLARGPFSVREAVIVLRDVSRALAYAHSRGVVHRDIKPDNILLPSGAATVTDFGLAKAVGASKATAPKRPAGSTITRTGTSIGTPAYMAPEQVAGDPALDHRADLYSLGIVAYEMLMGAPPFSGRTPQQVLAAHLTERPAPIATRRYDVPAKLVELIERLLAKDPADRPKAAIEVARLLETPDVVSGTFATLRRRRPVRLWRWIALAVTASMVGGALWWRTFAR